MTSQKRRSPQETDRLLARAEIVAAANKGRIDATVPAYSMRTIQRAVCACRRKGLVNGTVLAVAGYRSSR